MENNRMANKILNAMIGKMRTRERYVVAVARRGNAKIMDEMKTLFSNPNDI